MALPATLAEKGSVTEQLERLMKLHEQGALTDREFSDAKARVLRG